MFYMSLMYFLLYITSTPWYIFMACHDFYCHHISGRERDKINLILSLYILSLGKWKASSVLKTHLCTVLLFCYLSIFSVLYLRISSWRKMKKVWGCCKVQHGPSRIVCFFTSPRNFLLICNSHLASAYRYCW